MSRTTLAVVRDTPLILYMSVAFSGVNTAWNISAWKLEFDMLDIPVNTKLAVTWSNRSIRLIRIGIQHTLRFG
jgi:hypothetical protein